MIRRDTPREGRPRVVCVGSQHTQVFRRNAEDLHPDVAVPRLLRRIVNVFDRQRVHIHQDHPLQRLQRIVRAVAVVEPGLIVLETTRVNGGFTTPARLLRRDVANRLIETPDQSRVSGLAWGCTCTRAKRS